jgi:hypothetical protein
MVEQSWRNNIVEIQPYHYLIPNIHSHPPQWRSRCIDDSTISSYKTQFGQLSWGNTFLRFILVGILSRSSFQEKAITLDGAGLFQMCSKPSSHHRFYYSLIPSSIILMMSYKVLLVGYSLAYCISCPCIATHLF